MFKHYLNFKDLPLIGKIQVSEPFGFDGQSHKIKQDDGRYGRDVIIANETIKLKFLKDHFEFIATPQMLIDGVPFNHASHGFEYLAYLFEQNGWESEVEYIIEKNGTSFTTGIIDFFTANVKEDEIEFSIIQNTNRELIKRREDIYIDAFSDKDIDGNTIDPCQTHSILIKAKPLFQESEFEEIHGNDFSFINANTNDPTKFFYLNYFQKVNKFGVDDTKTWLLESDNNTGDNFVLVTAKNRLTDVKIVIDPVEFDLTYTSFNSADGYADFAYVLKWGVDPLYANEFHFVNHHLTVNGQNIVVNSGYSYTIPVLEKGESIWLFYYMKIRKSSLGGAGSTQLDWSYTVADNSKIYISAISTATDSVAKGIRLIDLLKHNVKSISGLNLNTNVYDSKSKNYDNFVFNGYLLARDNSKPFNNTFKDLMNIPRELNCDYQINENDVEILHYNDFYKNIEIGVFIELPNEENEIEFNKRYFLKSVNYEYKKSVVGRSTNIVESDDDVHTKCQFLYDSKKTDGELKIELKHIRSSFIIEEQRLKLNADRKTLENDTDLFILDSVALPENTRKTLVSKLFVNNFSILADKTFSWDLLGFNVGDTIYINGIPNTATIITPTVLTVSGLLISGNYLVSINYPLSNVTYMNRTNEGFSIINGVYFSGSYSNLRYHIKRNLNAWKSYFATAAKYLSGKLIKNTLFLINDKLETQLSNEYNLTTDKGDIIINDISNEKILNPIIHNITVFCDFDTATDFFKKVETDKGFVRIKTIKGKIVKGYPMDADYSWTENKLTLKLEEKYEGDYLTIDKVSGTIFINNIGYGMNLGLDNFKINNNFVCLYDINNILIANPVSFEKIKINNVLYTDLVLFSNALFSLI